MKIVQSIQFYSPADLIPQADKFAESLERAWPKIMFVLGVTLAWLTVGYIGLFAELQRTYQFVTVYLPQSYNFAGQLLIFPRSAVQPLDADSADVMAFIVSGGVTALPSTREVAAARSIEP